MRVKWNTSHRECDGRLREQNEEYEDFSPRALQNLFERGLISPVDEEAHALAAQIDAAKPIEAAADPVSDGEKE